jgi:predicted ester cyclase
MDSPVTPKTIARRIQEELFGGGQLEIAGDLYVPTLVPKITSLVSKLRTAFPDLTVHIDHLIAEDEKVACGWTATGTQRGWFFNIPPTGTRARWSGVSLYMMNRDPLRVSSMAGNWDLWGLMNQLRAAL